MRLQLISCTMCSPNRPEFMAQTTYQDHGVLEHGRMNVTRAHDRTRAANQHTIPRA